MPDDEATLKEETLPVQADSKDETNQKCQEEAKAYDGFDVEVDKVEGSKKDYDCKFKFWG